MVVKENKCIVPSLTNRSLNACKLLKTLLSSKCLFDSVNPSSVSDKLTKSIGNSLKISFNLRISSTFYNNTVEQTKQIHNTQKTYSIIQCFFCNCIYYHRQYVFSIFHHFRYLLSQTIWRYKKLEILS